MVSYTYQLVEDYIYYFVFFSLYIVFVPLYVNDTNIVDYVCVIYISGVG